MYILPVSLSGALNQADWRPGPGKGGKLCIAVTSNTNWCCSSAIPCSYYNKKTWAPKAVAWVTVRCCGLTQFACACLCTDNCREQDKCQLRMTAMHVFARCCQDKCTVPALIFTHKFFDNLLGGREPILLVQGLHASESGHLVRTSASHTHAQRL